MSFTKHLMDLRLKNLPVSIYADRDNMDTFCFGYIAAIDNTFVYINQITPYGDSDGLSMRKIEYIFRIDYEGDYEERLEKLYKIKKQSHEKLFDESENNLFDSFLDFLCKNKSVITIGLGDMENNSEITGIIERIEKEHIYLIQIAPDAKRMGNSIISIEDICIINYGTENEKSIQLLLD